jgi:hypothetical protein
LLPPCCRANLFRSPLDPYGRTSPTFACLHAVRGGIQGASLPAAAAPHVPQQVRSGNLGDCRGCACLAPCSFCSCTLRPPLFDPRRLTYTDAGTTWPRGYASTPKRPGAW